MLEPNCLILVISPEIFLKSSKVRAKFVSILKENISDCLKYGKIDFKMRFRRARLFIETNELEKAAKVLENCFGIFAIIEARKKNYKNFNDLENFSQEILEGEIKEEFAVRAKSFNKKIKSRDIEVELGSFILENFSVKVNLSKPKTQLNVLLFDEEVYFYLKENKGAKGMPVGAQGNVGVVTKNKKLVLDLLKTGSKVILINSKILGIEKFNSFRKFKSVSMEEGKELYKKNKLEAIFCDYKNLNDVKEISKKLGVKVFAPYLE
jgi:tRNA(Ser,Leu) C12 N-acetylase TAN1